MVVGLDGTAVRRWCYGLDASLRRQRRAIDAMNVFPVADRDTGTNLAATARAAAQSVLDCTDDGAGEVWAAMASGAVLGAHGNSGVILAEWLRGSAIACAGVAVCDAETLKKALSMASDAARAAVAVPVDGTMLTVARAAAEGAQRAVESVAAVAAAAVSAAERALTATTDQLPALRAAGVVDAGGAGLLVALEALSAAVAGAEEPSAVGAPVRTAVRDGLAVHTGPGVQTGPPVDAASGVATADSTGRPPDDDLDGAPTPAYEIQFLVQADDAGARSLRAALEPLGDSLALAGTGTGNWNVHIHSDDVSAVVAAGAAVGTPRLVRVTSLTPDLSTPLDTSTASGIAAEIVLLTDAADTGIAPVLRREGVQLVEPGGSTQSWLRALYGTDGGSFVLLPQSATSLVNASAAAVQARAAGHQVAVIPVRSVVQALAAIAVHDVRRRYEDDVIAMAEAAGATRAGSVAAGSGDDPVRGLIGADVVTSGTDVLAVAETVLDRLLGAGGELVTVVGGVGAPVDAVVAMLRRRHGIEVVPYVGGQGDPLLLFGVE